MAAFGAMQHAARILPLIPLAAAKIAKMVS
jgi:hypothetical protein